MNVEVTLEACEPGALMEAEWPDSLWIRPVPSRSGHCGEVTVKGLVEEVVPFLREQWGLEESDAWDVILSQQPPACVHCGLEILSGLVTNDDGDPYHELCKRKETWEKNVRRLAFGVDAPTPLLTEVPKSESLSDLVRDIRDILNRQTGKEKA